MKKIIFVALMLITCELHAQKKMKVFLDCNNANCDVDYFKSNTPMVLFVRDRFDADLHVLFIKQTNSSGAKQFNLIMIGQKQFANKLDTLHFNIEANASGDMARQIMINYFHVGLVSYLIKLNDIKYIGVTLKEPDTNTTVQDSIIKDAWRGWVVSINANGNFSGSEVYSNRTGNLVMSGDRETRFSKSSIWYYMDQSVNKITDDGEKYIYKFQNYSAGFFRANRFSNHWAAAMECNFDNSLYSNIKYKINAKPSVEYNFFKYDDFNSKRLVLIYEIAPSYFQFYDTTIFFKTKQYITSQNLALIGSFTQKWGSINAGAFWKNLFEDFSKNNLSFNGAISTRITKGLNFNVWGSYSFVHDQINLAKGNANLEDVLSKNRELLSAYKYDMGIGITYRFGSKYNTVVNPVYRGLNYNINM
jgi:hypothetical protein